MIFLATLPMDVAAANTQTSAEVAPQASTPVVVPMNKDADRDIGRSPLVEGPLAHTDSIRADLGLAVIGINYEHLYSRMISLEAGVHIFGTWFGPTFNEPNFTGFGAEVRPTFFPMDNGQEGIYVAPFFRVDWITGSFNGASGNNVGWSTGVFGGYSHMFTEHINGRFGAGFQFMYYAVEAGDARLTFHDFFPALDLDLGYAF